MGEESSPEFGVMNYLLVYLRSWKNMNNMELSSFLQTKVPFSIHTGTLYVPWISSNKQEKEECTFKKNTQTFIPVWDVKNVQDKCKKNIK